MTLVESLALVQAYVVAELFKLWHTRVAWATVAAVALVSPLVTALVWLVGDEAASTFPRVVELVYVPVWLLTGLVGLLLTVTATGSEFERGTVRAVVGRSTPRWLFIGGKAVAMLVALAIEGFVGTLSGAVFAIVSHLGQLGTTDLVEGLGGFIRFWPPAIGIVTLTGLAYVGLLLLIVVLVRSSALAMLAGLLVYGGDFIIAALGVEGFRPGAYSIIYSTSALFSEAVHVEGMQVLGASSVNGLDDPRRAFLTLASYAIAGVVGACFVFQRQDLVGAN